MRRSVPRAGLVDELVLTDREPDEFTMYGYKNVDLLFWESAATERGVQRIQRVVARRARETGHRMSSVHVLARSIGLPGAAARAEFANLTQRQGDLMACFGCVVPVDGFRGGALRGLLTGLIVLSGRSWKCRIVGELRELAEWFPAPHERETGVAISPAEFAKFFESARAAHLQSRAVACAG